MSIKVPCPHCERSIKVKEESAGKRIKCPGCGKPFQLDDNPYSDGSKPEKPEKVNPESRPAPGFLGTLLCKLGMHRFVKCRCDRCAATRDADHNWNGCKCILCGKTREKAEHQWKGCKCKVCGHVRNSDHVWNGGKCKVCGTTGQVDDAIRAAKSTDPNTRQNALVWMAQLGMGAAKALPQLAEMAVSDPDPKIQDAARAAQIQISGAGLNDPNVPQNSRQELASLLGTIRDARAVDQLAKALDAFGPKYDHSPYLLFRIVEALKNQGDRQGISSVKRALQAQENAKVAGGQHYPDFLPKCRDALKKMRGNYTEMDELVDDLVAAWKKGQDCDRIADTLIAIGDPECITILLEKFSPFCVASGSATSSAAREIARFGTLAIKPLSSGLSSDNKNIQEIAQEALEKITGKSKKR